MPQLPAVPNVVRIELKQSLEANPDVINRFFYSFTGTSTVAGLTAMATALENTMKSDWQPFVGSQNTLTDIIIVDLSSDSAPEYDLGGLAIQGSLSIETPPGLALVTSYHVARRFRGGHPRSYWGGVDPSQINADGHWAPTYAANFQTLMQLGVTNTLAGVTFDTMTPVGQVNVSYFQGFKAVEYPSGRYRNVPQLRAVPVVDPITSWSYNIKPASQRRRNLQSS